MSDNNNQSKYDANNKVFKYGMRAQICINFVLVFAIILLTAMMYKIYFKTDSIDRANRDIVTMFDQLNGDIGDIRHEVENVQTDISDINSNADVLSDNIDELRFTIDEIDGIIYDIGSAVGEHELNVTALLDRMTKVEAELPDIGVKIKDLTSGVNSIKKSIAALEAAKTEVYNTGIEKSDSGAYSFEIVNTDGTISRSYFESVLKYYNMLPSSLRTHMRNSGWLVMVTTKKLTLPDVTSRIVALTSFSEKVIYISQYNSSGILHEAGHYVDHYNGYCSSSLPDEVYSRELSGLLSISGKLDSHNYLSKIEYFASCFEMYYLKNSRLKENCPETYAFIESHLL